MSSVERIAYVVDGMMARGRTGSGHHIRNFHRALEQRGVQVACFDARTGRRLSLEGTACEREPQSRGRFSRLRLKAILPGRLRRALEARQGQRRAHAYLHAVGAFPEPAFADLERFAPSFILHRMVYGNTFVHHASKRLGVPYGLECNAPILFQKLHYGTLVQAEECRRREALVVGGARFIAYVSEATRRICRSALVHREPPSYVIPNCADEDFFAPLPGRDRTRAELGVAPDETLVIYVGSFKRWHRLDLLLEAARRLAHERIRFVLLGSASSRHAREVLRSAESMRNVIAHPGVPHREVPRFLAAADIGVQSGTTEYCAPLKLVEYMAAGLAIVAPRVAPIQEILADRVNAALVPHGDAGALALRIARLHRYHGERRRLAVRARLDATPYTWAANAQAFVELIERHGSPQGEFPTLRGAEGVR